MYVHTCQHLPMNQQMLRPEKICRRLLFYSTFSVLGIELRQSSLIEATFGGLKEKCLLKGKELLGDVTLLKKMCHCEGRLNVSFA